MDYTSLIDKLMDKAKDQFEDLEIFLETSKSIEIGIFNGDVDKYSISESGGLSLRAISNGKMGYSYTEKLDESSIDMVIAQSLENGKYIDVLDGDEIFQGSKEYRKLDKYKGDLSQIAIREKIEFAKNLEKEALSLDKRVSSVQNCFYEEFEQERVIVNTKGIKLYDKSNGALVYVSVIAKDGEDTKTGSAYRVFSDFKAVDYKEIAREAVDEAISMLGASPIKSGNYPMIIRNTTFADLIQAFSSVFSADNAQKGLSALKDKLGEEIANPLFSLCDDPFLEEGFASKAFDDEGTATVYKNIVDKGVLTSLLHTWKTAKKDGVKSTGNGSRPSYKSTLSIMPSNFYVKKGKISFSDLLGKIEHGVYITGLQGLHSGLNSVSGDFSLSAHGFEIKDGKINRPINQITIAGNLYQVLKDIDTIADDLKFGFPGSAQYGSPSVRIKSLSVAGE